jgi:hypothetical protein
MSFLAKIRSEDEESGEKQINKHENDGNRLITQNVTQTVWQSTPAINITFSVSLAHTTLMVM